IVPKSARFSSWSVKREWAVAEAKVDRLDEPKLENGMKQIGALDVLEHLRELQAVGDGETPDVRACKRSLVEAIRIYVGRVGGTIDRGKPSTHVAADRLLRPLTDWERRRKQTVVANPPPGGGG